MANRIQFFATRSDMILILGRLAELLPFEIQYVKVGNCVDPIVYEHSEDIPNLGRLKKRHCEISYLILKKGDTVAIHPHSHGSAVYPSENLHSLVFYPGGISEDDSCLIHGQFTAWEENDVSAVMCKAVRCILDKEFTKIRGWYIGREAKSMYEQVAFICIGVDEPEEYHFKL